MGKKKLLPLVIGMPVYNGGLILERQLILFLAKLLPISNCLYRIIAPLTILKIYV